MHSYLKKRLAIVTLVTAIITTEETALAVGTDNLFAGPQIRVETVLGEHYMEDIAKANSLISENKGEYLNKAFADTTGFLTIKNEAKEQLKKAQEEEEKKRQEIVDYACQFIGNPYVWGGTSLINGADCSGFVQSVFAHFGISLPRTSLSQRSAGESISYEEALPGDIICYDGHVGIYIGNGEIVNARNPEKGIGITPAAYKSILAVRRVI